MVDYAEVYPIIIISITARHKMLLDIYSVHPYCHTKSPSMIPMKLHQIPSFGLHLTARNIYITLIAAMLPHELRWVAASGSAGTKEITEAVKAALERG